MFLGGYSLGQGIKSVGDRTATSEQLTYNCHTAIVIDDEKFYCHMTSYAFSPKGSFTSFDWLFLHMVTCKYPNGSTRSLWSDIRIRIRI